MKKVLYLLLSALLSAAAHCGLSGVLSTPEAEGLISSGKTWNIGDEGLTVSWLVTQNADQTWHYEYTFSNGSGEPLKMDVSHFIISVSTNLMMADVYDFSGDVGLIELGTFGQGPSNPGFPTDPVYGLKVNLEGEHVTVGFNSSRVPMWGDFYAKGGGNPKNYAYNSDFGVAAANLHDYLGTPVDAQGNTLFKLLVPDTQSTFPIPEPATLVILGIGAALTLSRRF